jgi:hypothetical protein
LQTLTQDFPPKRVEAAGRASPLPAVDSKPDSAHPLDFAAAFAKLEMSASNYLNWLQQSESYPRLVCVSKIDRQILNLAVASCATPPVPKKRERSNARSKTRTT